jgi:hypothetical protein
VVAVVRWIEFPRSVLYRALLALLLQYIVGGSGVRLVPRLLPLFVIVLYRPLLLFGLLYAIGSSM